MLEKKQPFVNTVKFNNRKFKFSDRQKRFLDVAFDKETKIIFLSGPAGSSKTFLAVYAALKLMAQEDVEELLYVRSIAESGDKSLGSLPGDIKDKFDPFLLPLYEKIEEIVAPENCGFVKGFVEAIPINYLRGANITHKVLVADETQNFSHKELVTLITRLGEGSKFFIAGDPMQSDINGRSGFKGMFDLFNDDESRKNGICCLEFTEDDIFRDELLKFIIKKLSN